MNKLCRSLKRLHVFITFDQIWNRNHSETSLSIKSILREIPYSDTYGNDNDLLMSEILKKQLRKYVKHTKEQCTNKSLKQKENC